jgi:hypothetical protein
MRRTGVIYTKFCEDRRDVLLHGANSCQRRLKSRPDPTGWFLVVVETLAFRDHGGHVVVASFEEGSGAASAVGQTSEVHGAARAGVEYPWRGPRSRCVSQFRDELDQRDEGHPQWGAGRVCPSAGPAASAPGQCPIFIQEERIRIADLRQAGFGVRQIAARLGRAPSTISRELRRKVFDGNGYAPFDAHQHVVLKRARHHRRRVETNSDLRQVVVDLLAQRWSPQQISRHLHALFPDEPPMRLCHESIYQLLYQAGSAFMRPSVLAPRRRSPLRTGRDHRRAHTRRSAVGRGSSNRC